MPKVCKNKCVSTCLNIKFTFTPEMYVASLPLALKDTGSLSDSRRRKPGRKKRTVAPPQSEKIYAYATWIGHFYHFPLVIIYNRWGKIRVISKICQTSLSFLSQAQPGKECVDTERSASCPDRPEELDVGTFSMC